MQRCPQCLQGACRKHPLQDHGSRLASLKEKITSIDRSKDTTNTKNELIQSQIEKLSAAKKGTEEDEIRQYRESIEADRRNAEKRKRKVFTNPEEEYLFSQGSLNPSVISVMLSANEEGEDSSNHNNDNSSEEEYSRNSDENIESLKKKKIRKEEKKAKKKSSKKEKKSKSDRDKSEKKSKKKKEKKKHKDD